MPKLKTNSSAKKRFRRSTSGRIKARRANRNHILTKNTQKSKRQRREQRDIKHCEKRAVNRMLNGS